jgi:phospholipid/cholesterol/gamma-HCH transport system substrate-binding protein
MRPDPKAAFAVGLTVLLLLIALGVAFAVRPQLFSDRKLYTAHFRSAGSLDEGAPVYAHGIIAGRVDRVEWLGEGDYEVELRMDKLWQKPANGGVRLEETNPLRGAYVSVVYNEAACEDMLRVGAGEAVLASCKGPPGIIDASNALVQQLRQIAGQIHEVLGRLGDLAQAAGKPDGASVPLLAKVEQTATNIAQLTEAVDRLVENMNAPRSDFHKLLHDTDETVTQTQSTLAHLTHTIDGADQVVRANAASLQASVADLRYITGASSTSIVRLIAQLEAMTDNLAELTRELRDNPGVLVHGRSLDNPPGTSARPR